MSYKSLKLMFLLLLFLPFQLHSQQWERCSNGISDTVLKISGSGSKIIASTSDNNVFLSTNSGNDWISVKNGLAMNLQGVLSLGVSGDNLLAGTINGLFLSSDNGANWNIGKDTVLKSYSPTSTISSFGNFVYYSIYGAVLISSDYGCNWQIIGSGPQYKYPISSCSDGFNCVFGNYFGDIYYFNQKNNKWDTIITINNIITSVAAENYIIFAATDSEIYMSKDNGYTWINESNGLTGIKITSIISAGKYIFLGTTDGIYYSPKKINFQWTPLNNGLINKNITCFTQLGDVVYAGTKGGGVYKLALNSVGVEDEATESNLLSVYPNPAQDMLNIEFSNSTNGETEIQIFNQLGELVYSAVSKEITGKLQVNSQYFPSGSYYAKITNGNNSQFKQFVVIH